MRDEDRLIAGGLAALSRKLRRDGMPDYSDPRRVIAHALLRLHRSTTEIMLGYWLDPAGRLIDVEEVGIGSAHQISLSRYHLARRAVANEAHYAVFAHCHPEVEPTPSQADRDSADVIDRQLGTIGCLVLGHYVIARAGVADIRSGQVVRLADIDPACSPAAQEQTTLRCRHCGGDIILEE